VSRGGVNTPEDIERAARMLREARVARVPIAPLWNAVPGEGLEAAYRVAELNVEARLRTGGRIVGRKIGLTSKAVQRQLGVDEPDFGVLFDDMEFLDGAEVPVDRLMQPKVEAEVAFVLARDLAGPAPTYGEFLNAIGHALPALEIVDSAIAGWKITLFDTVADNASCGVYVLGDQPVAVGSLALAELGMTMTCNGATVSVGSGSACFGHPLRAAHWLARALGRRGQSLRAGEVILSGALGPMAPVQHGDLVQARIGALGMVSCRMV